MADFGVRILDAHTHLSGSEYGESPQGILDTLDACGVEKAFVFAPLLNVPSRVQMRQKIVFDNVWSHWQEAVKEPQRPKVADRDLRTPNAKSEHSL